MGSATRIELSGPQRLLVYVAVDRARGTLESIKAHLHDVLSRR